MEPRGGVDDVARGHPFAVVRSGVELDERLSGRDRHADLDPGFVFSRPVADREGGPNRSFRVVLVRDRRAEEGHDRVTDELLDRTPAALELVAETNVVRGEDGLHVLRVQRLGSRCEPDQVGEERRDDLAFGPEPTLGHRPSLGQPVSRAETYVSVNKKCMQSLSKCQLPP